MSICSDIDWRCALLLNSTLRARKHDTKLQAKSQAEPYTNAATKALPATTLHSPTLVLSAAPVVGEAASAVPGVEAVVFEIWVTLEFMFVPVLWLSTLLL